MGLFGYTLVKESDRQTDIEKVKEWYRDWETKATIHIQREVDDTDTVNYSIEIGRAHV